MSFVFLFFVCTVFCNTAQARAVQTPPLIQAVQSGHMRLIGQLIRGGNEINAIDAWGRTATHYAVSMNNQEALKLLLDHGADANLADNRGQTLLDTWQKHKNKEMLKLLHNAGAMPSLSIIDDITSPTFENAEGATASESEETTSTTPVPEKKAASQDLWQAAANNSLAGVARQLAHKWPFKFLKFSGRANNLHFENKVESQNLWQAAANNDRVAVEHLLDKGAAARVKNAEGKTPFDVAANAGHAALAAILLRAVAGVNGLDEKGWTPIHWAIVADAWDLVKAFIEEGADIFSDRWQSAFYIAKKMESQVQLIEAVIAVKGVDTTFENNRTALTYAVREGYTEVVKFLVDSGADINIQNEDGWTALMLAADGGRTEAVEFLVENGADINIQQGRNGNTALIQAARWRHAEVVKFLVENGADINVQNNSGFTALMEAADGGRTEAVESLVENGADINVQNEDGWTALMLAADGGRTEAVESLVENGADINIQNEDGWTALMLAATWCPTEVVEFLVENGADINIKDNKGKTALDYAKQKDRHDIVDLLRKAQQEQ